MICYQHEFTPWTQVELKLFTSEVVGSWAQKQQYELCANVAKQNQRTTRKNLDTNEDCSRFYQIANKLKKKNLPNQEENWNSKKTNHNQTKLHIPTMWFVYLIFIFPKTHWTHIILYISSNNWNRIKINIFQINKHACLPPPHTPPFLAHSSHHPTMMTDTQTS